MGHDFSTFLFAFPGSISGAGRLFDLMGTFDEYNDSRTPEEADLVALAMDFAAVGGDLRQAINAEIPEDVRKRLAAASLA